MAEEPKAKSKLSAYGKAVSLLARREHSVRELTFKLSQKEYPQKDIDQAIERLIKEKYLDNERFMECLIRARIAQGQGPMMILAELATHDISANQAQNHEKWQQTNWDLVAYQAKVKRFGLAVEQDIKKKAKQAQFLTRRGFSASQVNTAISSLDELSFSG